MARARVATATLTTTEAAVLALLAIEGERSGYDLLKQVGRAIGYVWAPARSHLYAVLSRLGEAGLVRARTVREGRRPEKQLYRLTAEGRTALDAWLRAEPDSRETFSLRLFVGALVPEDVLLAHVAWFRAGVEEELADLRRVEATNTRRGHDRYHYLLLRRRLDQLEDDLRWADDVAAELGAER